MRIFYMTNIPENESEKKENELEEGEINGETKMDKTSEGIEVSEVE